MLKKALLVAIPICAILFIFLLNKPIINTDSTIKSTHTNDSNQTKYNNMLKNSSFSEKDINMVGMFSRRVISQLNEICSSPDKSKLVINPKSDDTSSAVERYSELLSKIDEDKAIYLMLTLNKDFKGFENVFNEYLLSLQLDIDLEEYIESKTSYEKNKSEKLSGKDVNEFINTDKIEKMSLENIQKQNESNSSNILAPNTNKIEPQNKGYEIPNAQKNEPNIPDVNVKPKDPMADINKTINK